MRNAAFVVARCTVMMVMAASRYCNCRNECGEDNQCSHGLMFLSPMDYSIFPAPYERKAIAR